MRGSFELEKALMELAKENEMSNKTPEMEKFLDDMALNVFGRSRSLAQAGNGCVACGKPATEFRDELSRREYGISGLCQDCQDKVFSED